MGTATSRLLMDWCDTFQPGVWDTHSTDVVSLHMVTYLVIVYRADNHATGVMSTHASKLLMQTIQALKAGQPDTMKVQRWRVHRVPAKPKSQHAAQS